MVKPVFFLLLCFLASNVLAQPGMHGNLTVTANNVIVNEFTHLIANAPAGSMSIAVANANLNSLSRFSGSLAPGELIMIIQMQGATLSTNDTNAASWGAVTAYNNAGNYELREVAGISNGTTIQLATPLNRTYTANGRVQVVRVPRLFQLTLNAGASLSTDNWDGTKGGIVALEVTGNLTNNGVITATGKGFRGGTIDSLSNNPSDTTYASRLRGKGAEKGEGIGGNVMDYDLMGGRYGRGAPANGGGGGNSHNCGGGGGSNGDNGLVWNGRGIPDTSGGLPTYRWRLAWDLESLNFSSNLTSGGGRGGYSWSRDNENALLIGPNNSAWKGSNRRNLGGLGGRPLVSVPNQKIFMGGGGGAGDGNNNENSGGANGGGIICLVVSGNLTGNGMIETNGADAPPAPGKDAPGGGGGGGTVCMKVIGSISGNISLFTKGGKGGNQTFPPGTGSSEAEGPGGGGGGGAVHLSQVGTMSINTSGGSNGITNSLGVTEFIPNGATSGASGYLYIGTVLPVELLSFLAIPNQRTVLLKWSTATESNNDFFTIDHSHDGINFSQLTTVPGAGNSTTPLNYEGIHALPFDGYNYYILKQTDFDGSSKTYGPVVVFFDKEASNGGHISVSPVPFSDYIHVILPYIAGTNAVLVLSDQLGKVILVRQVETNMGSNTFRLNELDRLPKGIYYLEAKSGDKKSGTVRIVK
ncbi:MAG: T9SS type A sorting domain-containing protein [Bacteroidota bacterium]